MSLGVFVLRRVLWTIPVLLLVMLATFALMRGAGGTPFRPPEGYLAPPKPLQLRLSDFYRLEEPWLVEFWVYVRNVFAFDFGPSMLVRDLDVTGLITQSFPVTLELVGLAAAWAVPVGIVLGALSASRRGTRADLLATSAATVMLVIPVFFVAYVVSDYALFRWEVAEPGWEAWETKVLASLTLALAPAGYVARLIRAAMVETLEEDYVRTARAKGLGRARVIGVHVLRNSLVPFLSAAVPMLGLLVTGAFFVESFFRIPGASFAFTEAVLTRDYPVVMGMTVALAVVVLAANLVSDVLIAIVDPRLRETTRAFSWGARS